MNLKWKKQRQGYFKLKLYSTGRQLFHGGEFSSRVRKSVSPIGRCKEKRAASFFWGPGSLSFFRHARITLHLRGLLGNCFFLFYPILFHFIYLFLFNPTQTRIFYKYIFIENYLLCLVIVLLNDLKIVRPIK